VNDWRESNQNIVRFWYACENAAKTAVAKRVPVQLNWLTFGFESGFLTIKLPSGRKLFYAKAGIGQNRFGSPSVTYMGVRTAKNWAEIETYGGRLVENITQAVARDLLFHSIKTLTEHGIDIIMHVHDEVVCEVPKSAVAEKICTLMSQIPAWAEGLPLKADGYECEYYEKK
jgi:DNA polymerase